MKECFQIDKDVFDPVARRIGEKASSLHEMRRFIGAGIEGWFKVEVVAALGSKVLSVRNTGSDIILSDHSCTELKAGCGLDIAYIRKGVTRDNVPCLVLRFGYPQATANDEVELVKSVLVSDGYDEWVVALIRRRC